MEDVKATHESSGALYEEIKNAAELYGIYEDLFDGTLGHWTGKPYNIKLKDDANPYYGRPYKVPHAYKRQTKGRSPTFVQNWCPQESK